MPRESSEKPMSKANVGKYVMEKSKGFKEKENPKQSNFFFRHFKRIYPLGIHRSNSLLSESSLSLSNLSQSSNESSLTDFSCSLDQKILLSLESLHNINIGGTTERRESNVVSTNIVEQVRSPRLLDDGEPRRCHWITKNSDKVYVSFHDEHWGVPVYDDNQLFEVLSMCGMLMDYNWTEILKRRPLLREAFKGFEPNMVANMGEKEIIEIASNKELGLAECRARCIVENARGILKVVKEHGSWSSYIWGYFNYKPIINKYKLPRNVPLRTPKSESISKDLLRRGFRLVGPVITQSFLQVAGLTIDHLVDCFRYNHCVALAENPWRHL